MLLANPGMPTHITQHDAGPLPLQVWGPRTSKPENAVFPGQCQEVKRGKASMPGIHEEVNSASTRQEPWAVKIFARLARSGKNGISKHVREMYYATTAGQFATEVLCTVDQEATKNTSICLNNSSIQQRLNQIKRIRAR